MAAHDSSRTRGILLMGTGALGFLGTTGQWLPAEVFFPALLLCALGMVIFVRGQRAASARGDAPLHRAPAPELRHAAAERFAARQAQLDGRALDAVAARETRPRGPGAPAAAPRPAATAGVGDADELLLDQVRAAPALAVAADDADEDAALGVSTDVSFPLELQQSLSLAEQLSKLNRLREDGVISDAEFAIAKAKLLG